MRCVHCLDYILKSIFLNGNLYNKTHTLSVCSSLPPSWPPVFSEKSSVAKCSNSYWLSRTLIKIKKCSYKEIEWYSQTSDVSLNLCLVECLSDGYESCFTIRIDIIVLLTFHILPQLLHRYLIALRVLIKRVMWLTNFNQSLFYIHYLKPQINLTYPHATSKLFLVLISNSQGTLTFKTALECCRNCIFYLKKSLVVICFALVMSSITHRCLTIKPSEKLKKYLVPSWCLFFLEPSRILATFTLVESN